MNVMLWGVFEEGVEPPRVHVALCDAASDGWPMWHQQSTTCPCQPRVDTETTLNGMVGTIIIHREVPAA